MLSLLLLAAAAVPPSLPCLYAPRGTADEVTAPACLLGDDPVYRVAPAVLRRLQFERNGRTAMLVPGPHGFWLHVLRSGRALHAFTFDNGPDYFRQGLTRATVHGKIAFYDRRLQQRIAPQHDFAFPFESGRAVVCDGCTPLLQGEHTAMVGGTWTCMDLRGRTVAVKTSGSTDACGRR